MRTTVIGSYPLSYAQMGKDAVVESVKDQLRAGVDIVSDGQTRYDMIEYFARSIDGYEYSGRSVIAGKVTRGDPAEILEDLRTAMEHAPRVKGILTGPVTLVFSSDLKGYYRDYRDERLYMDTADALLDFATAYERLGVDSIQIDEPFLSVGAPMEIAKMAVEHIASGVELPVALHVCGRVTHIFEDLLDWDVDILSHAFMGDENLSLLESKKLHESSKILGFGCIDTKSTSVEPVEGVVSLIGRALEHLDVRRLLIHPDCGLRGLPRDVAYRKLVNMVKAAERFRGQES